MPLPEAGTPLDVAVPARADGEHAALAVDLAYARGDAATLPHLDRATPKLVRRALADAHANVAH